MGLFHSKESHPPKKEVQIELPHHILTYEEPPWVKVYINKNTSRDHETHHTIEIKTTNNSTNH